MTMVEILKEKLKQIFVKTEQALTPKLWASVLDDFLTQTEAHESTPVTDVAYQFPAYLRRHYTSAGVAQTADFEWAFYSRTHLDWGTHRREPGFLSVNTSLVILPLDLEAATLLKRKVGAYAIFRGPAQTQALLLTAPQAQLLEVLLAGDRKYRAEQLVQWMTLHSSLPEDQWSLTLADLLRGGIIDDNLHERPK
jgi:hypothetical protein